MEGNSGHFAVPSAAFDIVHAGFSVLVLTHKNHYDTKPKAHSGEAIAELLRDSVSDTVYFFLEEHNLDDDFDIRAFVTNRNW